jgi:hypothetical protein
MDRMRFQTSIFEESLHKNIETVTLKMAVFPHNKLIHSPYIFLLRNVTERKECPKNGSERGGVSYTNVRKKGS